MSIHSHHNLLEQYRLARTRFNTVDEQQETLYHKRLQTILKNSSTSSYKHTLIQSKRREWSIFRHQDTYRSPHHSMRISKNIRNSFQINPEKRSESSNIFHQIVVNNIVRPRLYPPTFNLQTLALKEPMNMNILHEIKFLGQFDRKFLICKHFIRSSNINKIQLILFDQHAISERILLERLQNYFKKAEIRTISFQLSQPVTIARNPRFLYTIEQISLLEHTGFVFSSISMHNLLIRSVPSWLLSFKQRKSSTYVLDDIIQDTINNILLQNINSPNNIELIIYETLKSLACHNAIKFNDILSNEECQHLLHELKFCSMPFICAHGRTSAAILWEYDLIDTNYEINMNELKQLASIHKWFKSS